jgi:uncharacterized protein (DUF2249 family)
MSSPAPVSQTVDIRTLGGCTLRKARVLETFDGLDEGDSLLVVNDHLPKGLLLHFEDQRPGRFKWTPMEEGPEVFSVLITKRASAHPSPRDPAEG